MVASSLKAPSSRSPISTTLSDGEPPIVSTLPVQLTFFLSNRPKVDSQLCCMPLRVPEVHPTKEKAMQPATKPRNANPTNFGRILFLPTCAIVHDPYSPEHALIHPEAWKVPSRRASQKFTSPAGIVAR